MLNPRPPACEAGALPLSYDPVDLFLDDVHEPLGAGALHPEKDQVEVRIAFTFNMKKSSEEAEAEFDTPATVEFITRAIEANGHEVVGIDVTGTLPELIEKLQKAEPDLIFNTAEGTRGSTREALYPAVFDELNLPYTGSDAHCLTVTLDKYLTNLVVERVGVRTPRSLYRMAGDSNADGYCPFPCIVKPNFEGSSKGITDASVVTDSTQLQATIARALKAYPEGILIEEFVPGTDVAVPFVEGLGPEILTPCSYEYDPAFSGKHRIYDYRLKNESGGIDNAITIHCPAKLAAKTIAEIKHAAKRAVKALGIRNLARFDFRVRDDGTVFFIEANANPSLEDGASIYTTAAEHGCPTPAALVGHINNAVTRWAKVERTTKRLERARKAWMLPPTG